MKNLSILIFLFLTLSVFPQSHEVIKRDTRTYLWGEGSGSSISLADQEALSDLISQISVFVESTTKGEAVQVQQGNVFQFEESFKASVTTYSRASMNNAERIILSDEPNARVFRYIKRSEVDKIFRERQNKIIEFARYGQAACREAKVADALRYYYWALTLLRSHPDGNSMKFTDENGNESLMATWLHRQIGNVFSDVQIVVSETREMDGYIMYLLRITYQGKPVVNFDYTYWTGRNYSSLISARNGFGVAEISGTEAVAQLDIKAEYVFEGEAALDQELRDVLQRLEIISFRGNHFYIPVMANETEASALNDTASPALYHTGTSASGHTASPALSNRTVAEVADTSPYAAAMSRLVTAIHKNDHQSVKNIFTHEGFEIYQSILGYGNALIIREPELRYIQFGSDVIVRSIPVRFSFPNNNRHFVEDVVVHFNSRGLIFNITFGLDPLALQDILNEELPWTSEVRWVLINFMENYKTAFALKRLDYIESLFDDQALIIVGRMLQSSTVRENRYADNPIVRYNRLDKQSYIRNLRNAFNSNEFINIRFQDNTISKAGRAGEVYGIQIKQDYFSSNYGDTGYLFLMVDVNEPDTPVIHVRTWQPHKNADGSIYGLTDF
jgi:hypothetical protein